MAQVHPWSAIADPAFFQTLSLLDALEIPAAAIDAAGCLLYESGAFAALPLPRKPKVAGGVILLRDCIQSADGSRLPFISSGALRFSSLPFAGRCKIQPSGGASQSQEFLLRIEPYRDLSGNTETAICVVKMQPASGMESAVPALSLLRQWQPRIEEIGDSFDPERIASKTRSILQEITNAGSVTFYWLNGNTWQRSGEEGDWEKKSPPIPETIALHDPWISLATENSPIGLGHLEQMVHTRKGEHLPGWMIRRGRGFALACKTRGDALALIVGWGSSPRWAMPAALDLLDLVAFQAAQAIDYARWFQFARQSESRSEQFIDNANAIIVGLDLRGEVTVWNRKAQEVFGFGREEIVGRSAADMLGGTLQERQRIRRIFQELVDGGSPLVLQSLVLRDKAADLHDIEWNTSTLTSAQGRILGFYAIGQDVTRRKELERSLEQSEKRYRTLVESTHDLYWTIRLPMRGDFDLGRLVFINRSFAGQDPGELMGRGVEALRPSFAPESWARFRDACMQAFRTGRPVPYVETDHINPRDVSAPMTLRSDLFPLIENDKITGVQGLTIDVTQHKQIEARALQAQKLESIGTLAMGVSHDFNNILHGISGFSFLISRNPHDADKVLSNLKAIQDLTDRASRLTRQLQSYANQATPQKRPLDLNEVVRQSVDILDVGLARHIEVDRKLCEGLPWIDADRSQIEQILLNLFINGIEAMGDTGTLTISTRLIRGDLDPEDLPPDAPSGDYCVLEVRDTGCGMTPEVAARIFDPFFTTKRTGNGLGLSSVFGILRRHDAHIRVDTEPGRGTCFLIYLPAIDENWRILDANPRSQARGGTETILFVDDEPSIRQVSEDILTGLGYRVILAENGEEAVEILRSRPNAIDLVLVDIAMPILNGRAAVKIMRMARPDLKVLFTSGHCDAETIESLYEEGYHHFLSKPFSMLDLQSSVRNALDAPVTP